MLGAFYVLMTVVVILRLGFSLFYVLLVGGQLVAALVIDLCLYLLFERQPTPVPPLKYLGCALTLAGAGMRMLAGYSSQSNDGNEENSQTDWMMGP